MKIHCVDRLQFGAGIEFQRFSLETRKTILIQLSRFFLQSKLLKKNYNSTQEPTTPASFFNLKKYTNTHKCDPTSQIFFFEKKNESCSESLANFPRISRMIENLKLFILIILKRLST